MDCVVCPWLYGTLSGDLLDIVMRRGDSGVTARATWLAIESQFLGNREARALILDAKLRTLVQGDLAVVDYCKRLRRPRTTSPISASPSLIAPSSSI